MNTKKIHSLGFGGWLALIFITLKLCKVIAWSWWWVLAPLWIPLTIVGGALIVGGLLLFIGWIIELSRK